MINLSELLVAWREGTVIRFRYALRRKTTRLYAGRVDTVDVRAQKVRVVLCDPETLTPLSDDFGDWQRFTFSLQIIDNMATIPWLKWPQPQDQDIKAISQNDAQLTMHQLMPLFAKSRYEVLETLKPWPLYKDEATGTLYRNHLAVNDSDLKRPVLSERMVYDILTKTWRMDGLTLHTEQPLHRFFKQVPTSLTTLEDALNFLQDHQREAVELDTRKAWLLEQRALSKRDYERLSTWFADRQNNRPFAHLFKRDHKVQRGRKTIQLPALPERFNPRVMHAVYEAMKGPLTLIQATAHMRVEAVLELFVAAALMSEFRLLIVDSSGGTNLTPWPGILRLSDVESLQEDLTLPPHHTEKPLCRLSDVKETVFSSLEAGDAWVRKVTAMQAYAHHSLQHGLFHENIRLQSALNDAYQAVPIVPFASWFSAPYTLKDWEDTLCKKARTRHMKLSRHGYASLNKALEKARQGDVKQLFKALQDRSTFHKLKQIFPVIVCRNTAYLPYVQQAFDQVVIVNPKPDVLTDSYYGERLTLIETTPMKMRHNAKEGTPPLLAAYYGDWFNYFKQLDRPSIKVLPEQQAMQEAPVTIHRMHHSSDHPAHCVLPEAEQLVESVKTRLDQGVVRTPFNQQRHLLQTRLETPVKTLHHPVIGQPLWISWAIHQAMPQKTYDWLKNNPYVSHTLVMAESIESWVDVTALDRLSDGEDRVYHHVMKGLYPESTVFRLPSLSFGFKKLFEKNFKATVMCDQPLETIKGFESFKPLKASYVFKNDDNRAVIIVLTDSECVPLERLAMLQAQGRKRDVQVWVLTAAHKVAFLEHLTWLRSWGWIQGGGCVQHD